MKSPIDWVDVVDEPYGGARPTLPKKRKVILQFGAVKDFPLNPLTKEWWQTVSLMPHCTLWKDSDWQFAIATALVADAFFYGSTTSGQQLAQREKVLGTTMDARRDLRIRYVAASAQAEEAGSVTSLDDYRAAIG